VIVVGEEPTVSLSPAQTESLKDVFKTGKALTTAGLILHAAGLAIMLGNSGIQTNDAVLYSIISLMGFSAMITGPIISCAGATSVENSLNRVGGQAENPKVWAEYGWGWLFLGGSTALTLGAVTLIVQSYSNPTNNGEVSMIVIPIVLIAGAIACEVLSEVEWMKCVIHAHAYISRMERKHLPGHTSISITPVFTLDGRAGARLNVGF
jgi:hypothetical protein